jgi:coenzyme F420-reducing hydrogenase beta subunit
MGERTSYLLSHDVKDCCACRACEQVCPVQCISMVEKNGFLYPKIDQTRCIHCHQCEKVCQYTDYKKPDQDDFCQEYYACWNQNREDLLGSTSGGLFIAAAKYVLDQQGVVYGAVYTKEFNVVIARAQTLEECRRMQGSKYAKSDTKDTYAQVKQDLDAGKLVLYTGTPCQIAGLNRYLKKPAENLLTIDIICHGTPSVFLLKSYIQKLQDESGKTVSDICFRRKKNGWKNPYVAVTFEDGNCLEEDYRSENRYAEIFGFGAATDSACSACLHAMMERNGDLTIGDFWNIESINPAFTNLDGTSVILVNTIKGKKFLQEIQAKLTCFSVLREQAKASNPQLSVPSSLNPLVFKMIPYLKENGFDKAYIRYVKWGKIQLLPYRAIRKIKNFLRRNH